MKTTLSSIGLAALMATLVPFSATTFAQSVSTNPVGAVNVTVAAGTGTSRVLTVLSLPLLQTKTTTGLVSGRISSVTPNSITVTSAGWTPGGLSAVAAPTLIKITSGAAQGRFLLVSTATPNTADTLTIDATEASQVNLTTLGLVTGSEGDTFTIYEADTLASIFEGMSVQRGTSATADLVQLLVGGSLAQFFQDNDGAWRRVAFGSPISNNVVIRPESLLIYNRIANTPLTLTLVGDVPLNRRTVSISNSGLTTLSSFWPVNVTLSQLNLQSIPGWVSNSSVGSADTINIQVGGSLAQYYFDGVNWRRVAFGNPISDTVTIPAGAGVLINRRIASSGVSTYSVQSPYQF